MTRRRVLLAMAGSVAVLPAHAQTTASPLAAPAVQRNIAGFRSHRWQDHFDTLDRSAVLADTKVRALHFWHRDGSAPLVFPTSVPISPELTRLGYTEVVGKVDGPSWRPTPSMRERNPDWPAVVGPGPDNPLGSHALYLSWQYYRIHGTHDVRKVGRQSSDGCIGLLNENIAELYARAEIGTRVKLI
ncbi:MAG: L,D-transpeptidase [Rhodobacteraceae bacterium]|nr:L,D-transpeptidase [Paracoccaceae bacterium]